jgi:uncharacterized protein YndB with AHSA1/START domain
MTQRVDESIGAPLLGVVRKVVTVPLAPEAAFRLFTRDMATWWPVATHSIRPDDVVTIEFEEREGGHVVERWADGGADWGIVVAWDPPRRLVLAWSPTLAPRAPTEVEVTFEPTEDGRTTLVLEHRGWAALGDLAATARASYEPGWDVVLDGFSRVATA